MQAEPNSEILQGCKVPLTSQPMRFVSIASSLTLPRPLPLRVDVSPVRSWAHRCTHRLSPLWWYQRFKRSTDTHCAAGPRCQHQHQRLVDCHQLLSQPYQTNVLTWVKRALVS